MKALVKYEDFNQLRQEHDQFWQAMTKNLGQQYVFQANMNLEADDNVKQ